MCYGFSQIAWDQAKEEALQVLQNRASRRHSQPITYTELVESLTAIKIEAHDPRLSTLLDEISVNEHTNGHPLITVLVVHKGGNQRPGPGFYDMARRLGFNTKDKEAFWSQELQKTLNHWQQENLAVKK